MTDNLWEGTEIDTRSAKTVPDEMPCDITSEASFLATIAWWGNTRESRDACRSLDVTDFYNPTHRYIFEAIRSLQLRESEISLVTVNGELERVGKINVVGGFPGLTNVLSSDVVENVEVLTGFIKAKTKLRELISIGSKIAAMASSPSTDPEDVISTASEAITRLASAQGAGQIITDMSDLAVDLQEGRAITTENGGRAMSWGDDTLDNICPIPRGEPVLIVARPGVGKSALGCIQVPVATYLKGLGKPLVLSLEMGRQKVKARMAAHLTGTNSRAFRDAHYTKRDIDIVASQTELLTGIKWMFPKQECPVEEIESLVHYGIEVHGIDCIVLDQFSHLKAPKEARNEPFAMANAALSRRLTAMAKNLNLGWVTLGQINRDGDDSRRPTMKDLADTDRLAKDAAVILGLWNTGSDENQQVWATIMKNRDDGFKGWAKRLASDYGTCTFRVMESETSDPFKKPTMLSRFSQNP